MINENIEIIVKNGKLANSQSTNISKVLSLVKKRKINYINELSKSIEILKYNQLIEFKKLDELNCYITHRETELKNRYNCKICFDSHISTVLIPCGHMYCSNCVENITNCYYCRQQIEKKQKLYFS